MAKAKAEGNAELARALYQEMVRVQGLEREDEQIAYDRERDALADQRYDQQYADMLAAEEYDKKATRAAFLAQIGNFSGYAELWGLSQEETASLVAEYARQKQLSQQQAAYELEAMGLNNQLLKKQVAKYGDDSPHTLDPTPKNDGPTPPVQPDIGLADLNLKLSQMEDRGGKVLSNVAHLIKQYESQQLITPATAQRLLAQYGL